MFIYIFFSQYIIQDICSYIIFLLPTAANRKLAKNGGSMRFIETLLP